MKTGRRPALTAVPGSGPQAAQGALDAMAGTGGGMDEWLGSLLYHNEYLLNYNENYLFIHSVLLSLRIHIRFDM